MSTQDSSFPHIPFSITHPEQPFRLLELPPELLELITSQGGTGSLKLKAASPISSSATTTSSKTSTQSKDGFLHLCTNDKVYAVRQVSTSNSVFVISPTPPPIHPRDDVEEDEDGVSGNVGIGLTAISKPTSTLELIPTPFTRAEIIDSLRTLLPVWDVSENSQESTSSHSTGTGLKQPVSLRDIRGNLPFPDSHIDAALKSLFAISSDEVLTYDHEHDQSLIALPTAALLLQAWRMFVESDPSVNREDIPLLQYESVEWKNAIDALRIDRPVKNGLGGGGEIRDGRYVNCIHTIFSIFTDTQTQTLKAREIATFLGELLLLSQSNSSSTSRSNPKTASNGVGVGIPKETLLNNWLSLLPQQWTQYCTLEVLNPAWHVIDPDAEGVERVMWRGPVDLAVIAEGVLVKRDGGDGGANAEATGVVGDKTMVNAAKPASGGGGAGKKMGKWHEKFAKSRK